MLTLPDKFKSSLGTGTSTSLFPVVRFFKGVRIDDPSSWVALDLDDIKGMKMMNTTITKWLRLCVDGDASDEFLKTLTLKDRTDIFIKMQESLLVGEGKASDSK